MQNNHQIEMSHDQISELINGLKEVKKSNEEISVQVLRLNTFIAGNELDKKDRGMIGRLEKVEKRQELFLKYYWMFLGGAIVVGFIIQYILPLRH